MKIIWFIFPTARQQTSSVIFSFNSVNDLNGLNGWNDLNKGENCDAGPCTDVLKALVIQSSASRQEQTMTPNLYFSFERRRRKVPARYANSASLAPLFEQIVNPMSEDGHVNADRVQLRIDLERQTQKIAKPMSAAQMIDHSLPDQVLAGK